MGSILYRVVAKSECKPDDCVSFDGWSFAEACGIAAALNSHAVFETGEETGEEDSSQTNVYFARLEDYRFMPGYGIKRIVSK